MRDPRGGPPWAIRVFAAERFVREHGKDHPIGRARCSQLGRLVGGRFGWIDATNTFRPVPIGLRGVRSWCGSRKPDAARNPLLEVVSRITDPSAGEARVTQTIAWSVVGAAGRPALRIDGRAATIHPGRHGTFLAVVPTTHAPNVTLTVRYPTGRPVIFKRSFRGDAERFAASFDQVSQRIGRTLPAPTLPAVGARPTVDLRLPDPNGGLPWGIAAARAEGGGWCLTGLGRIVGDRVGDVDYELGTFSDHGPDPNGGCPTADRAPSRSHPLAFGYGSGGGFAGELGRDPMAGRIARRTLRGMTTFSGSAKADVRSITIASPRDVRTIRPSGRAHAFAAVYDGEFPTGKVTLTATFTDGSTHRDTIEGLGF